MSVKNLYLIAKIENEPIMKQLLLLFTLLCCGLNLSAQRIEKFSDDASEFISELNKFMASSKTKSIEQISNEFTQIFKGGVFTEDEVKIIMETCNLMLNERMAANPYFANYLTGLTIIKKEDKAGEKFKEWHTTISDIIVQSPERKLQRFQEFIKYTNDFFRYKTLKFSEGSTNWLAIADDYSINYIDDQPQIKFEKIDLMVANKKDSIYIYETSGVFFPVEKIWKGSGGKVTWDRIVGEDQINAYVILADYELDVKRSLYEAENVKLYYPLYFGDNGIEGKFADKLSTVGGTYPRFESYSNDLEINNFGNRVNYLGGFRLQGNLVYGSGDKENRAVIGIFNEVGELAFKGEAESFTIRRQERIVGEQVKSVLYFGQDSIYHPSVNIRYDFKQRSLQLSRGNRGSDRNPFYSTLHKVNIDAEHINAIIESDSILIGKKSVSLAKNTDVFFESLKFYEESDYRRVQNIATTNPIALMKITAEKEGTNYLDANLIAKRINAKFTVDNIQSLIFDLTSKGFISYDRDEQIIEIKDKIFHYADASQDKVDFDLIKIRSNTENVNAVLDLNTLNVNIEGVKSLEFSPRQKVGLVPDTANVLLKDNRNMDFDGKVFAGFSTMTGKGYHFDYDKFNIQMDTVSYFDLFVPTKEIDKNNRPVARSIGSRVENLTGVLLIDAPSNKSGRENIPMFPSFQSKGTSFVYYDSDSTLNGVYGRDSFYFQLEPFSFNHLDAYGPKDIQFKGTFRSAGIFPDFDETLRLQDHDQSLGFVTKNLDEIYPNYKGKGQYKGQIQLSNQGLEGKGNLQYLGASVNSENIVFKPKELTASAELFDLEEVRDSDVQVPKVHGVDVNINWKPYKDSMYVRSDVAPFELFQMNNHTLDGTLILTPGGLKADGVLDWDKASLKSKMLSFGAFSVDADTADVGIKAFNSDDLALRTFNVKANIDFDKEVGFFESNDDRGLTQLPYNQYETTMDEFDWDMKEETISFKDEFNEFGGFLSTNPKLDSLKFEGKTATYAITTGELQVVGVPHIVAADAFIYPDSGYIEIQPGGSMKTLENAQIIADTLNRYHVINKATVDILGRRHYKASGFYEYNINDKQQEFELSDISGQPVGKGSYENKQAITRATGEVTPTDSFYIDHKTTFQGTITLNAQSKNLKFDGFARLNLDPEKIPRTYWFSVHSEGDKKDLAIGYDVPNSYEGEPLKTGLYLSKETANVYPSVMMPLKYRKDRDIFPAKGVFKYDENTDEFIFGDSSKVIVDEMVGNRFVYENSTGNVRAEGKFNIGSGLKYIEVFSAGIANSAFAPPTEPVEVDNNIMLAEEDSLSMFEPQFVGPPTIAELMTGIKLNIPEPLLKAMATDFKSSGFEGQNIVYLTDMNFYKKAIAELFPRNKDMNEAVADMNSGSFEIPKKYNPYTLLFSKLKLKWDPEYQSFLTTSNKSGIISINGEPIGKMVTCYIECKMPTTGDDRLYIYLKSPNELYYYFGFKQGILSIVSNNVRFMEEFEKLKPKDLIMKMPDGETYEIQAVETGRANLFLRRIEAANE